MTYVVLLTRIRPTTHRDERTLPESVICRCEFDDRDTAIRTARAWAVTPPVRIGRERVKLIVVGEGQPPATEGSTWTSVPSLSGAVTPPR